MTMEGGRLGSGGLSERGYGAVAIGLHWTIAALILLQMVLGWWMNEWVPVYCGW